MSNNHGEKNKPRWKYIYIYIFFGRIPWFQETEEQKQQHQGLACDVPWLQLKLHVYRIGLISQTQFPNHLLWSKRLCLSIYRPWTEIPTTFCLFLYLTAFAACPCGCVVSVFFFFAFFSNLWLRDVCGHLPQNSKMEIKWKRKGKRIDYCLLGSPQERTRKKTRYFLLLPGL